MSDSISAKMQTAPKLQRTVLVDTIRGVRLQLVESSKTRGKLVVRGEFAYIDRPTANGRVYRRHVLEKQIARLKEAMVEGGLFGHLDHPADGTTLLTKASHLVTKLEIDGDTVFGEATIMDTPDGLTLKALYAAGARVGVSSRGFGSTRKDQNGNDEVQDDYELVTFDFVAEPAASTFPEAFSEARKEKRMNLTRIMEQRDHEERLARLERIVDGLRRTEESRARRTEARAHERGRVRLREATRRANDRLEEHFLTDSVMHPVRGRSVESGLPDVGDFRMMAGVADVTKARDKWSR
jgi:hypothetical protein